MELRIEELSLGGWPALQTLAFDGWLLRFAEGYSKRSNSVNPLYGSSLPLEGKVEACEALYRGRGLPAVFKLLDSGEGRALDGILERRGYRRLDATCVRALELGAAGPGGAEAPAEGIELADSFRPAWIDAFCACSRVESSRGVIGRILGNVICPVAVAAKVEGGEIVACGYGAVDRGRVGLFDIVVRPDRRGRGFGEGVVRAILGRARELGATGAYLQVVVGNAPAEGLYSKLGFRELYRYWYRKES